MWLRGHRSVRGRPPSGGTYRNHVPDCCVAIEDDRTLVDVVFDPDPDPDVEEKVVLFTVEGVVMP